MELWTAQYRYPGPWRLDITVKGDDPTGKFFAPTWDMVKAYKAGFVSPQLAEDTYTKLYMAILAGVPQYIWDHVMNQPYIVLVCFCGAGNFCHRNLLRDELIRRGAQFQHEITDFSPWIKA